MALHRPQGQRSSYQAVWLGFAEVDCQQVCHDPVRYGVSMEALVHRALDVKSGQSGLAEVWEPITTSDARYDRPIKI